MEVHNAIKKDLFHVIIAMAIFQAIYLLFGIGSDDSDKNSFTRSDMKVYTDYKTGNQYLSSKNGDLIPRLGEDGQQININKQKKENNE